MKKFLVAGLAGAALIAGGAAFAQSATTVPTAQPTAKVHHSRTARPITRAEVQAGVEATFARLDVNHDGFITREEAQAGKRQRGGGTGRRTADRAANLAAARARLFDRIDANHDGMISRDEFNAPHQRGTGIHHASMGGLGGKMFDRADANKDGRVSLAEAQQAALAKFDAMDLNHDGTVTPDERQQARLLRKGHKRS